MIPPRCVPGVPEDDRNALIDKALTGEDGAACVLHLHSRGEDAFDSLSHYSREIAKFVRARHADARLTWIEAGHDRPDFRLKWP